MKQQYYLWDASIDYARLGLDCDSEDEAVYKLNQLELMLMEERREVWQSLPPNEKAPALKVWKWMGAAGWTDGMYSLLRREKRIIVIISGYRAQWAVQKLSAAFKAVRIDVQLTVWYPDDRGYIPERMYTRYYEGPYQAQEGKPKPRLILNGDEGATCYIGKRGQHHGRFFRCYDKWREKEKDDEWKYAIRYEVELTGKHAIAALESMRQAKYSPAMAAAIVGEHMRKTRLYADRGALAPEVWRLQPQRPSTKPRAPLMWLNRQVRPAIAAMLEDGIPQSDLLAALTTEMGGEVSDNADLEELRKKLRKKLGRE